LHLPAPGQEPNSAEPIEQRRQDQPQHGRFAISSSHRAAVHVEHEHERGHVTTGRAHAGDHRQIDPRIAAIFDLVVVGQRVQLDEALGERQAREQEHRKAE
jgi:hypothetical protein